MKMLSMYFISSLVSIYLTKYFYFNRQITQLLKKFDILHMKKTITGEDDNDDRYFLHTYDDYFS